MIFIIEIQYRIGASYETRLQADSEQSAKTTALAQAKQNGFGADVKRMIVIACRKSPKNPLQNKEPENAAI